MTDPRAPRVCLVTPAHLSTNPRLVKEADALAANGYDVSVVCTRFIAWADQADAEFSSRPWGVRTVAYGPLAGRVTYVAQSARRRAAEWVFARTGRCATSAVHPAVHQLSRTARARSADLYIAHNLAALPAAARAAKAHGARLGFDAEDFHRGEFTDSPAEAVRLRVARQIEDAYLPRCDYLTAASPGIADAYAGACGVSRPTVVLNVFPLLYAPPTFTPRGSAAPGPSLCWFSQTVGPGRGLELAVAAVARSRARPTLYLRGNPSAGYREALARLAGELGVKERVVLLPPAPPGELVGLAARYDAGLALEPGTTENNRLALSNKLFTYLLAGIPILALETPAQAGIAAEMAGAMSLCGTGDTGRLVTAIDDLLGSPARLAHAREAAWRLGQSRFNWDVECRAFLSTVSRSLAGAQ